MINTLQEIIKINMSSLENKIKLFLIYELYKEKEKYSNDNKNNDYRRDFNIDKISDCKANEIIDNMCRNDIHVASIMDEKYPDNLRHIDCQPCILFYKGDIDVLNNNTNVAIVGARDYTDYGKKSAQAITEKLCDGYVTTISGGARGIDSIIHEYTIKNNTPTVSVLGNGLNIDYPKSNRTLFKKIQECGCIISEFTPDTPPMYYNFPRRNRIISGLADYVVVVEGGEKSGTSITASFAADQGRDVYAVPGSVFSKKSQGPNKLILEGATPIYNLNCIIDMMKIKRKKIKNSNNTVIKDKILQILEKGPQDINYIIKNTDIDTSSIYELLFELQNEKEIVILNGNYYAKIE